MCCISVGCGEKCSRNLRLGAASRMEASGAALNKDDLKTATSGSLEIACNVDDSFAA